MGIQRKIVTAIVVAGFVLLATGMSITYYYVKNVLSDVTGRDFAIIARKTASRFDDTVRNEITTFQHLAANKAFIKGVKENKREAIEPYLTYYLSYVEERSEHLDIFVVNEKGKIIASGNLMSGYSTDQSNEFWWQRTYNNGRGKVYASDIYLDQLIGSRAFDIGVPVFDPVSGIVVGGIRSILNVDVFFSFVKEMDFGRTGHGMLVDSEGTPLICPLLPLARHSMNRPLIGIITAGSEGWAIAEDDAHGGRRSIVGFSPIDYVNSLGPEDLGGHKWYTFVRQDPRETFAPVKRLMLEVFLLESIIIAIISVIGVFIASKILLQPIGILHTGIEQIEKGDLNYKINIRSRDELASLARGFNKMGNALKESYYNLEEKIKERTNELEKTKNYLESILRYSTDMIVTSDLEARIVTFNEGAEQMLGYKRDEVIGKFIADFYYDKDERAKLLDAIRRGEMVTNYETRLVRKDGRVIDISLSLSLLRDKNGKVIGTVGISKDITELKKAQRELKEYSHHLESMVEKRTLELKESKSHLEAMLSGIADGIVFTDQDNKITFINDAAEQIFDIKRDDWMGKDFRDAHSPESHEKALRLIHDMRDGKVKSYSSEIRSGEKTIYAHFSPIMHGDEYLGVIFIARDITEMKRLQTELVQSEKLVLVGKMSSAIAHELRNPLVPIGGFARIIYRKVGKDSPLQEYAGIIIKEIDRLERLLHEMLYFTKEIKPVLQPVNLNDVINDMLLLYRDTFTENNIHIKVHLSAEVPKISLDLSKIKQALVNICYNAIQAMPEGGTLTIETGVEVRDGRPYALVRISDTGCGIPEDIKKRIFDPFYTTKIHGLGLGLTLTKGIIESHGGEIEVESEEGKGATFIISLPVNKEV